MPENVVLRIDGDFGPISRKLNEAIKKAETRAASGIRASSADVGAINQRSGAARGAGRALDASQNPQYYTVQNELNKIQLQRLAQLKTWANTERRQAALADRGLVTERALQSIAQEQYAEKTARMRLQLINLSKSVGIDLSNDQLKLAGVALQAEINYLKELEQVALRRGAGATLTGAALQEELARLKRAEVAAVSTNISAINAQATQTLKATRFQRLTSALTGREPASGQAQFGQFFGQGALSSLRFGLPSMAIFGAVRGIASITKEASEIETIFARVDGQFRAFDGLLTGNVTTMKEFRQATLDVAEAAGQHLDVTAELARQLAGAFADVTEEGRVPDFSEAFAQLPAALDLSRITNIDAKNITDELVAIQTSFADQNLTFMQTSDLLIGLEEEYPVLAGELAEFTADLAPLASGLGFTVEQLTELGAVTQSASGRSLSFLSEQLGRILPGLQTASSEVFKIMGQSPSTTNFIEATAKAFSEQDIPGVLQELTLAWQHFDREQKSALGVALGGDRQAGTLFTMLEQGQATINALNPRSVEEFAGTTEQRMEDVRNTVTFSFNEITRSLEEFGLVLFESGLSDFLRVVAGALKVTVESMTPMISLIGSLVTAFDQLPMKVLATAAAFKIFQVGAAGLVGGLISSNAAAGLQAGISGSAVAGSSLLGPGASKAFSSLMGVAGPVAAFTAATVVLDSMAKAASQANKAGKDALQALRDSEQLGPEAFEQQMAALERDIRKAGEASAVDQSGILGATFGRALNFAAGVVGAVAPGDFLVSDADAQASMNRALENDTEYDALVKAQGQSLAIGNRKFIEELVKRNAEGVIQALKDGMPGAEGSIGGEINLADLGMIGLSDIPDASSLFELDGFISPGEFADGVLGADYDLIIETIMLNEEVLQKLLHQAYVEQREGALSVLHQLFPALASSEGLMDDVDSVQDFLRGMDTAEGRSDVAVVAEQMAKAYELGLVSFGAFMEAKNQELEAIRLGIEGATAGTTEEMKLLIAEAEQMKEIVSEVRSRMDQQSDLQRLEAELTGMGADAQVEMEILEQNLAMSLDAGVPASELADLMEDILKARQQMFEQRIEAAETDAEKLRLIEEGYSLSDLEGKALAVLRALNAAGAGGEVSEFLGVLPQELADMIMAAGDATIEEVRETVRQTIEARRLTKLAQENIRHAMSRAVAGLAPAAPLAFHDAIHEGVVNQINKEADEAVAGLNVIFAPIRGTSGNAAQVRNDAAKAAKDEAEAARKAAQELAESILALREAQAGTDHTQLASLARERAQLMMDYANTDAERNNAMAAMIEANRQGEEALLTEFEASRQILLANAEHEGNEVDQAKIKLENLMKRQEAQFRLGLGDADRDELTAEIRRAESALLDARIQSTRESLNYQEEMGHITTGQVIAGLQALLEIPNLGAKRVQELNLEIKRMRDQLGQDFAFNLPSELALPTLYEVRRLNQTPGGASGYTDARQITINFSATDASNAQEIADYIVNEFSRPSRFGTVPRRS